MNSPDIVDSWKQQAAAAAATLVRAGMTLGLGTGSTAGHLVDILGRRHAAGELDGIRCLPTSRATERRARAWGLPIVTFTDVTAVDLTIDGADEIDPQLDLIKGLGGALLWEKIVASASDRLVIIADAGKCVRRLGEQAPVPVEVIPFAQRPVMAYLQTLGARTRLRQKDGVTFLTDEKNVIIDCFFDPIDDAASLASRIRTQPGVVEHGLFLNMATAAYVADADGVRSLSR